MSVCPIQGLRRHSTRLTRVGQYREKTTRGEDMLLSEVKLCQQSGTPVYTPLTVTHALTKEKMARDKAKARMWNECTHLHPSQGTHFPLAPGTGLQTAAGLMAPIRPCQESAGHSFYRALSAQSLTFRSSLPAQATLLPLLNLPSPPRIPLFNKP